MTAYYNEIDPYAAQWLRNLIKAGHIAPGYVDERSIIDVKPEDLTEFTQCHFFAGIGAWSLALRNAGFPDDRPVWTGSCPCQPFSAAGNQLGAADERHLAPVWLKLIKECQPAIIFGEQVAAAIGKHWFDDLFNELEEQGYACGAAVLPACSVGAPHIRQRLTFGAKRLADTDENTSWRNSRAIHGEKSAIFWSEKPESDRSGFISPIPLFGADGMERKVSQSCFPLLVDGSAIVLAQNSAYGNAIVPQAATEFIIAFEGATS